MIDLSNVTFVMPVFIDSSDRLRNVIMSASYLLKNFDCKLIIKESSPVNNVQKFAIPLIEKYVGNIRNLTYIFDQNGDFFHRTKLINDMILMADTEIVCNYDCDVILPESSCIQARLLLEYDIYDVVYPYRFGASTVRFVDPFFKNVPFENIQHALQEELVSKFMNSLKTEDLEDNYFYPPHMYGDGWAEFGFVQFFKKSVYIEGYMENENFLPYQPEDVERFHRFEKLGYRIGRLDNHIYHIEHHRPPGYGDSHLWEVLKCLSKEDLIEYYERQKYVKHRRATLCQTS